ncbi:hypothetical protein pclt_cds_97 [Pandoravirus celtis]|uniref:Lipopolysaccharide assembly protein A domain-containing protein n=1 Tax=Pandoravirus celtis TaxID=2568002 RepID=A0A4D6EFQ6_9VIRU|nr:hypothetical protein pclt_cds_97 [Pandoravirus celtis]
MRIALLVLGLVGTFGYACATNSTVNNDDAIFFKLVIPQKNATLLLCASLVATAWVLVIAWLSGILSFNHNLANLQGRIDSADESLNRILAQLNAFNVHKAATPTKTKHA